jgi:membrane protease YdiL (CAAX protease family)
MTASITTFAKKHSLVLFFILAYTISWLIWLPQLASAQGFLDGPELPYLHLLGGLGPTLAALIVTGLTSGRTGLRELGGRMVRWRVGIRWHLIAWFGPVALFAVAAVIARLVWGTWPEPGLFGRTREYPHLPVLAYWAVNLLFFGFGEETGWRGFALPHLQKDRSAMAATLILSLFWAFWHLPLFGFVDDFMKMGLGGAAGWYFSILLGSVLLTWLYNSTWGSILIVAVFHGTLDVVFNSPVSGDLATIMGMLITIWGIAVIRVYQPAALSQVGRQVLE